MINNTKFYRSHDQFTASDLPAEAGSPLGSYYHRFGYGSESDNVTDRRRSDIWMPFKRVFSRSDNMELNRFSSPGSPVADSVNEGNVHSSRAAAVKLFVLLFFLLLGDKLIYAADDSGLPAGYLEFMGGFVILVIAVMFFLLLFFNKEKYETGSAKLDFGLSGLWRKYITKTVPIEQESDIMLDHDYDGIKELDNKVPPWFNILFYGTIVFSVIYMLVFHVFNIRPLMHGEYLQEMTEAQQKRDALMRSGALINEDNVTLLTDESAISNGRSSFASNCSPCHGPDGGGSVGPNLTDNYWIHGGGIKNVFTTIKYGVPAKGMISWQNALPPKKLQELASYVLSLQGSKPQNPKQPEGNIYIDSVRSSAKDSVKAVK